jgi:hypothetical protein
MDHIVTSKIFRKLKNRYDLTPTVLKGFKEVFFEIFAEYTGAEPKESLECIENEIRRIERGGAET